MTMILDRRTLTIFDGAAPPQSARGSPGQAPGVVLAPRGGSGSRA